MATASLDLSCSHDPQAFPLAAESDISRPLRRARRRRGRQPWLRRIVLASACIAVIAHFATDPEKEPGKVASEPARDLQTTAEAALVAPPPRWEPSEEASSLFALRSPDGVLQPADTIRRHRSGARQDGFVFGSPGDEGYAQLTITRNLEEAPTSFFVELVRLAGEAGLAITRSQQGFSVETKFGPFEAAGITASGPARQDCIAFRFAEASTSLRMGGWICGSEERPADRGHLACLIDRLALMPGADDEALDEFFARAESRRDSVCAPAGPVAHRDGTATAARKGS